METPYQMLQNWMMVTVVDSANLIKNYSSTDFLNDRGEKSW